MGDALCEQLAHPTGQPCPTAGQHRTQQMAEGKRSPSPRSLEAEDTDGVKIGKCHCLET